MTDPLPAAAIDAGIEALERWRLSGVERVEYARAVLEAASEIVICSRCKANARIGLREHCPDCGGSGRLAVLIHQAKEPR